MCVQMEKVRTVNQAAQLDPCHTNRLMRIPVTRGFIGRSAQPELPGLDERESRELPEDGGPLFVAVPVPCDVAVIIQLLPVGLPVRRLHFLKADQVRPVSPNRFDIDGRTALPAIRACFRMSRTLNIEGHQTRCRCLITLMPLHWTFSLTVFFSFAVADHAQTPQLPSRPEGDPSHRYRDIPLESGKR